HQTVCPAETTRLSHVWRTGLERGARQNGGDISSGAVPATVRGRRYADGRACAMLFESCVESCEGVRAAREAGAHRVELCANLLEGGTTPSLGMIRRARMVEGIRLHVIIRPRGGDF